MTAPDQTEALRALLEKVETGNLTGSPDDRDLAEKAVGDDWLYCAEAYVGSLDAAVSLCEAVLPEYVWLAASEGVDMGSGPVGFVCPRFRSDDAGSKAEADTPARALLTAIIRAKLAELEGE